MSLAHEAIKKQMQERQTAVTKGSVDSMTGYNWLQIMISPSQLHGAMGSHTKP